MTLFLAAFEAVATLLGIGVLGFWLISRRVVPADLLRALYPLALDVALPALIFASVVRNFRPATSPGWWLLPLWWAGFTALAGILSLAGRQLAPRRIRREFAMCLFFQNATFFPIALIVRLHGDGVPLLAEQFLFTLFFSPFLFSTFHVFFPRRGESGNPWRRMINPVFVATLLAVALCLGGWQDAVPAFMVSAAHLVGAMAIPLLMLILGGNLCLDFGQKGTIRVRDALTFVVLKNLVFPLLTLAVLVAVRPEPRVAFLVFLQSAMPPLTSVPLLAERQGGDRQVVNQFILVSFLASLGTIPAGLALFNRFFAVL